MIKKEITIYDIAREAGVSPATVSRVITKSAGVSAAKRTAVEALIQKYNFQPNAVAKGLSDTKTRVLGLLVADIQNPFYATLSVECELAANRHGYTTMLTNTLSTPELEESNLEKLYAQRVDAIIQVGSRTDDRITDPEYARRVNRITRTIPFLSTGRLEGTDCYTYGIDHKLAMQIVLEHLLKLGHREIAVIGGEMRVQSTYDKWMQYVYMMGRNDLPIHEEYLQTGNYGESGGYACMTRLLNGSRIPTAVIAVNDYTAFGALRALHERGLSVPGDMSLISYDNTFLSKNATPKLTSVDYNYAALGQGLVDLALQLIYAEEAPRVQLVAPSLVVRHSCAAPNLG